MRVKIVSIKEKPDGRLIVEFESPCGRGRAEWMDVKPIADQSCDAQFDFKEKLEWGRNLLPGKHKEPGISMEKDIMVIRGTLERIGDEGLTVIRLGDSLITLAARGAPQVTEGPVELRSRSVKLYDAAN
jgi:hypothetical protein